jgi:hypothetical protein
MATVYYVRDGTGEESTNAGRNIPLASIARVAATLSPIWSKDPPSFGRQLQANAFSAFRHVVVHVEGGETAGKFTKDGYWYLTGMSPAEFERAL